MLSKKARYAMKALLHLAKIYPGGPVLISDLAQKEKIPKKFLELILLDLKHRGLLQSKKGKGGGYSLAKPPGEITFGPILRMFEGPLALVPCASVTAYRKCDDCDDEASCGIRLVMKDVRDATAAILDGTTIADVLERIERIRSGATEAWM